MPTITNALPLSASARRGICSPRFPCATLIQKTLPLLCALLLAGVLSGPAARAADHTNSIGMQFNNIPAGRFYMGSCELSEAGKEANKKRKFMGLPAKGATCPSGAGDGSGRQFCGQRLWPVRYARQCLGVGGGLLAR